MLGSGNFGKLIDGVERTHFGLAYNEFEPQYPAIYDIRQTGKAYEQVLSFTGLGLATEKVRGASIDFDEMKQNWEGRHIMVSYGKGYIIERELYDDGDTRVISMFPQQLALSARYTIEYIAAAQLNNCESTAAAYVNADGLALASTAHLLGGGGTFSNRPAAYADLDSTSLEQAYIDIGAWVNDAGVPIAAKPVRLITTTANQVKVQQLLGSDKVPEDANNAINTFKSVLPYSINNYLTDSDSWFLKTNVPNGMVFYWRRKPDFSMDNEWSTESAMWKFVMRCVAGCDDPRGIYVNLGG